TGTLLSRIISSNSVGLISTGAATGDSGALQAPHRPVSARCLPGIRFGFPQDGQFRMMGMAKFFCWMLRGQYFGRRAIDKYTGKTFQSVPRASGVPAIWLVASSSWSLYWRR